MPHTGDNHLVVDASGELDENDRETAALIRDKNVIVLLNKSDLPGTVREEDVWDLLEGDTGNSSQEKQAMEGRDQMQWGGEKGAPGEDSLLSAHSYPESEQPSPCHFRPVPLRHLPHTAPNPPLRHAFWPESWKSLLPRRTTAESGRKGSTR